MIVLIKKFFESFKEKQKDTLYNKEKNRQNKLNLYKIESKLLAITNSTCISNELKNELLSVKITDISISARLHAYHCIKNSILENKNIDKDKLSHFRNTINILSIPEITTINDLKKIDNLYLAHEISIGNAPTVTSDSLIQKKGEYPYWIETSILMGNKTRRVYHGGSKGISVRIAKGVSYNIGALKGYSESFTEQTPIDSGEFVITNKRLCFIGNKRSFNINFDKILSINLGLNSICIHVENKETPYLLRLEEDHGELVAAAINWIGKNL